MMKEKHYKISGEDYFVNFITEKVIDYSKKKSAANQLSLILSGTWHFMSKEGIAQYKKEDSKESQTGKFNESWRDYASGDSYHSLIIELNEKPKKKIRISEIDYSNGTGETLEERAFEKNEGFFIGWDEVSFKEIKSIKTDFHLFL
jgi:hypothetical protein